VFLIKFSDAHNLENDNKTVVQLMVEFKLTNQTYSMRIDFGKGVMLDFFRY
jgi:hypothetical protein